MSSTQPADRRDWVPVAPTWERKPDDKDTWRRVVTLPGLALNRVERELLAAVAGRRVGVLGAGEGFAALALAALGARVTVVDPAHSLLDLLMVRAQVTGVEIQFINAELPHLGGLGAAGFELCYAAQVAGQLADLGRFYADVFRLLVSGGRLVVNEYHPVRRIWKPEPGSPRFARSYFERRYERPETDAPDPVHPAAGFGRFVHHWTVADHHHFLVRAGFRVTTLEEVGEVRQHWEVPNLRGLPEQLIIGADKPE